MQPIPDTVTTSSKTPAPDKIRAQRGFSLFELLVYILAASILFSVMLNRYRDFPGEAERASFIAVLGQLRAGVNMQMMSAIAEGSWQHLDALDGSNPMDLMLEVPGNYLGEFSEIDASLPRRSWYFDTSAGHLVYHANQVEHIRSQINGDEMPTEQIRFVIRNIHGDRGWQGLTLAPVYPYEWRSVPLERALTSD